MDKHFADWYHIANLKPEHQWLALRWKGVEEFGEDATPDDVLDLCRLFYHLEPKQQGFRDAFCNVFRKQDNAFRTTENDIELSVLAGAVLGRLLTLSGIWADLSALALISAMFVDTRKNILVPGIVETAFGHLITRRNNLRKPEALEWKLPPADQFDAAIAKVTEAVAANELPKVAAPLDAALKALGGATTSLCRSLASFSDISRLMREDSQVLWWLCGQCSRDLEKPFAQMSLPEACLVAAKEFSDLIDVLPGPLAAPAVLATMVTLCRPSDSQAIQLQYAVNSTPREWRQRWIGELTPLHSAIDLCPVLSAVQASIKFDDGVWQKAFAGIAGFDAATPASAGDLSMQCYTEMLLLKAFTRASEDGNG